MFKGYFDNDRKQLNASIFCFYLNKSYFSVCAVSCPPVEGISNGSFN